MTSVIGAIVWLALLLLTIRPFSLRSADWCAGIVARHGLPVWVAAALLAIILLAYFGIMACILWQIITQF